MKISKWIAVFVLAFIIAWIVIFTFIQEPFALTVPMKLLWYTTPGIPIYVYVVSAFAIGLLIGFLIAGYYYLTGQAGLRKKSRRIKALELKLREVMAELKTYKGTSEEEEEEKKEESPQQEENQQQNRANPARENGEANNQSEK
ncbi:lipopolysaccharide assembly protein LapA domain-containing protein [Chitinispirillales bacterium ANBcel5]|uniref:lipopolysaccharide assembly protein LapA domain-containing protein n=1 Tax=Cellulosispirillum alkaliphilum TaxID=3039283 RepID=UPI002A4F708F|nr:lipopolysaccharide assembly protein LapA domain-containing protein [Chitinispirillales bacterium ANBcel5]